MIETPRDGWGWEEAAKMKMVGLGQRVLDHEAGHLHA